MPNSSSGLLFELLDPELERDALFSSDGISDVSDEQLPPHRAASGFAALALLLLVALLIGATLPLRRRIATSFIKRPQVAEGESIAFCSPEQECTQAAGSCASAACSSDHEGYNTFCANDAIAQWRAAMAANRAAMSEQRGTSLSGRGDQPPHTC